MICKIKGIRCVFATASGYCEITACVRKVAE